MQHFWLSQWHAIASKLNFTVMLVKTNTDYRNKTKFERLKSKAYKLAESN